MLRYDPYRYNTKTSLPSTCTILAHIHVQVCLHRLAGTSHIQQDHGLALKLDNQLHFLLGISLDVVTFQDEPDYDTKKFTLER